MDWHSRRTLTLLASLVAGALAAGALIGGSVSFGLCAVLYLVHRQ